MFIVLIKMENVFFIMNLRKVKMMKYDLCQYFNNRKFFYAMILRLPMIAMWSLFVGFVFYLSSMGLIWFYGYFSFCQVE
jgi:hypothetical protein